MAANQQQNILVSLITAHSDTVDAQKRLIAYMNKHIAELEQMYINSKKEADEASARFRGLVQEIAVLKQTIEELSITSVALEQASDLNDVLDNMSVDGPESDADRLVSL